MSDELDDIFPDDEARLAQLFDGIDGPRPVPSSLHASLEGLLTGGDPAGTLARTGADDPRPLPADADERVAGALVGGAGAGAGRAGWRRGLHVVRSADGTTPRVLRIAAILVAVVLVAGTVAVAAELTGRRGSSDVAAPPTGGGPTGGPADLVAAKDCDDLLDHFQSNALALVDEGHFGRWGGPEMRVFLDAFVGVAGRASSGDAAVAPQAAEGAPPVSAAPVPDSSANVSKDASGTNVQEAGVDEPDIVKVEAERVFTLTDGMQARVIRALRPTADGAALAGTFELPPEASNAHLLLSEDRLLALSTVWSPEHRGQWTKVWVIDVSDLARMRLVNTVAIEGSYTTARLVDGLVRVVVATDPVFAGPAIPYPADGSTEALELAKRATAEAVKETTLDDWVANYELTTYDDGKATTETGRACACENTLRPVEFSGFTTVTVLTIDPADPKPDNVASVTGAAGTTYASLTDLFVASVDFSAVPLPSPASRRAVADVAPGGFADETSIHQFSITEPNARHVASGKVPGALLSQFSMSQHGGHLRVASTAHDENRKGGVDNLVSVLRRDGDELKVLGQVRGLGEPGERIHGVRMIGDTGYVVTFRQIDPLYVLDLADPAKPAVLGELKIPGVSTYLHPMGSDSLIGFGAEANEQGRRTGVGMSVFDVSDKADPRRAAHLVLGNGYSGAEQDHHGFLYWAKSSTVVVPYFDHSTSGPTLGEAVVIEATPTSLTELGRVSHSLRAGAGARAPSAGPRWMILRSAVVGDQLWTFSGAGILINDLGTLAEKDWVSFGFD